VRTGRQSDMIWQNVLSTLYLYPPAKALRGSQNWKSLIIY